MNAAQERAAQAAWELERRRRDAAIRALSPIGKNGIGGGHYLPEPVARELIVPETCQGCCAWDDCKGEHVLECAAADEWYEEQRALDALARGMG